MKSKLKLNDLFVYILIVIAILIVIFFEVITKNKSILLFYGDNIELHYLMALGFSERIRNLNFSFWDWSLGFGTNIFSMSFYNLFSPFTLIFGLISSNLIKYAFLYLTLLKFIFYSVFSLMWLSQLTKDKKVLLVSILISTFSGFNFFYIGQQFFDVIVFFPLALFFIESYIKDESFLGLSLTFTILTITNYYFAYMFVPFSLLYFVFRCIYINDTIKIKSIFMSLLKLIFYIILGILIGAIVLFPVAYMTLSVPRLSNLDFSIFDVLTKYDIFRNFTNIFSPAINFQDASFYINTPIYTKYLAGSGASIYTSVLTVVLLPYVFLIENRRKRLLFLGVFFFLAILMFFPVFSLILNGDFNTRWYFMFSYFFVLYIIHILEEMDTSKSKRKLVLLFGALTIILMVFCTYVSFHYQLNSIDRLQKLIELNLMLSILVVLFSFVILLKGNSVMIIVLLCVEIIFNGRLLLENYGLIDYKNIPDTGSFKISLESIKEKETGFYRIKNDGFKLHSYNIPFAFNFPGLSIYSSLYSTGQQDFLDRLIISWTLDNFEGKHLVYNLLSTKYFQVSERTTIIPYGYIADESLSETYLNKYYVELGYISNKTISEQFVSTLPYLMQDRIMQENIVSEQSDVENFELNDSTNLVVEYAKADYFEYISAVPLNGKIIYIENFGVPEVTVELYSDEKLINTLTYYQFNYIDYYIRGDIVIDKLIIKANDTFGYNTTVNLYIQDDPDEFNQEVYMKRLQNSFSRVDIIDGRIVTEIYAKEKGMLFTSIPFDKGWRVLLDENEVEKQKVNFGFIGVELDEGNHKIEFRYMSPYFIEGSIVSLLSVIILLFKQYHKQRNIR